MHRLTSRRKFFGGRCLKCENDTFDIKNVSEGDIRDAITKLAEYEDLEDEGLLLKLPCKVGEKVYKIYYSPNREVWEIEERRIKIEDISFVGKTVFLTRMEAETMLKKIKNMCTIKDAEIGNKVIVSDYFSREVSMPDGMRELVGKVVTIIDVVGDMVKIKENSKGLWINISLFDKNI